MLAKHRAEYERWTDEVPDFGLMTEPDYIRTIWPDGTQPVTAPAAGEWRDDGLHLASVTPGPSIGYQVLQADATVGTHWAVYIEPVRLLSGERLVAVAHRIGFRPSSSVGFVYEP